MQAAGKQEDAERLYRRATALAPENAEILFAYAAFRRECGDAAQAATLLERVVAMVPDAVNGWLELTRARHDLAQWDACVAAAERTLALDASCLEAELMRAVALFAQHKHDEAAQSIERVAEKLPDDAGVQLFHARCHIAQNTMRKPAPRRSGRRDWRPTPPTPTICSARLLRGQDRTERSGRSRPARMLDDRTGA